MTDKRSQTRGMDLMLSGPGFRKKQSNQFVNNIDKVFKKQESDNSAVNSERIKSLESEVAELKAQLEKVSGPKKELIERIKSLESENSELKANIEELQNEGEK